MPAFKLEKVTAKEKAITVKPYMANIIAGIQYLAYLQNLTNMGKSFEFSDAL